ncbi:hypothetical protein INT45_011807, partial [Circinella minor]
MSTFQEETAMPTVSAVVPKNHLDDDMMSESGSAVSVTSSSRMSPRIAKLIAKIAFLEEEMVRDDLSEEDLVKVQKLFAIHANSLDMMLGIQKKLAKKDKAVTTTLSSRLIVPSDLPLLQWTGNCRLLPRMLSPDQRSWFIDNLKPHAALDWSFARKTLVNKYGIQDADRQAQYMQELFSLKMGRDDSVEQYTDHFHKLRREAGCEDNRVMAALYIKSLLPELSQHVTLGQAHLSPDKRATINHAANLARRMYGNVVHSKYSKQVVASSDSSLSSSAVSVAASGPSFAVSGKRNKGKKRADAKHCRLHGAG